MYRLIKTISLFVMAIVFFGNCTTAPKNDNQTNDNPFVGFWREGSITSGTYNLREFKDNGNGKWTRYVDHKVSSIFTFHYVYSDSQITIRMIENTSHWTYNYEFTNNFTLLVEDVNPDATVPRGTFIRTNNAQSGIEYTLLNAANSIIVHLKNDSNIAIINIFSNDNELAEFIAGELETIFIRNRLFIVDRNQLDRIRQEQNLHLSGDIDENSAVSIGKLVGASVVILGNVSGTGDLRRLRLRALDTQTARVLGVASEAF